MNDEAEPGYQLVDHTSEVTLRLRAPTFSELVIQAARAFLALVPDQIRGEVLDGRREVDLDEADPTATLVAWLNEMVFHDEAEAWIPVEPEVEEVGESGIRVRAKAMGLKEPFVLVKAATFHDARIREVEGLLQIEVTLDI